MANTVSELLKILQYDSEVITAWFKEIKMTINADKSHKIMLSSQRNNQINGDVDKILPV